MDIIEAARQLGAAMQEDERYKNYIEARLNSDKDEALQALIGEFNLAKMSIDNELEKNDEKDSEKIKDFNLTLRKLYGQIMCNDSMMAYNKAKQEFEAVMQRVNGIIELCSEGEDPKTCEPAVGCTGSCATCGGCH